MKNELFKKIDESNLDPETKEQIKEHLFVIDCIIQNAGCPFICVDHREDGLNGIYECDADVWGIIGDLIFRTK